MKTTPGPWDFACDSYGKVRHSKKACVYSTFKGEGGEHLQTIAARIPNWSDARLIAAAPDLFSACNALLGLVQIIAGRDDVPSDIRRIFETGNHRIEEARAAIIKAVQS